MDEEFKQPYWLDTETRQQQRSKINENLPADILLEESFAQFATLLEQQGIHYQRKEDAFSLSSLSLISNLLASEEESDNICEILAFLLCSKGLVSEFIEWFSSAIAVFVSIFSNRILTSAQFKLLVLSFDYPELYCLIDQTFECSIIRSLSPFAELESIQLEFIYKYTIKNRKTRKSR